jgi:hypothetical protein
MAERAQPAIGVNDQAFIATLEKMPALPSQSIEPGGKRALQPTHPIHQICLRGGDRQVIVIRHQAPRMYPPPGLLARFGQTIQKGLLVFFPTKNVRTVIAPVKHMIHPVLDSIQIGRAIRLLHLTSIPVNPNPQGLTLFSDPASGDRLRPP